MKNIFSILLLIFICKFSSSQHWQQFSNNQLAIFDFYVDTSSNTLYANGVFIDQNNDTVWSPAYWDGANWQVIGNYDFKASNAYIYCLIKYNHELYIGGNFRTVNGAPGNFLLKLDTISNSWDTLLFSPDDDVKCFYEFRGSLLIGGKFWSVGPMLSPNIVSIFPPLWSTFPLLSIASSVEVIDSYNDMAIMGGIFNADIFNNYEGNIVGWNGANYVALDDGLYFNDVSPRVEDLQNYQGKIYMCGLFTAANLNTRNIVVWDGNELIDVGGGSNGGIYSMVVFNGQLFAAGMYTQIGGIPAENIAKWDGSKWCSLGTIFNGSGIGAMCVYNNELIISGGFNSIDGIPINHVAKWVGGNFTDSCQVVGINEVDLQNQINIYPSPANSYLKITGKTDLINKITLVDPTGKRISVNHKYNSSQEIDVSYLSSGLYFLIFETNEGKIVKKCVKE